MAILDGPRHERYLVFRVRVFEVCIRRSRELLEVVERRFMELRDTASFSMISYCELIELAFALYRLHFLLGRYAGRFGLRECIRDQVLRYVAFRACLYVRQLRYFGWSRC